MDIKADRWVDNSAAADGNDQIVIIMGMHRSGTSVAGQLLNRLGFYFGNNLIKKIDTINADGFWEDRAVVAINERILELLGSNWYSYQPLPPQWWTSPAMEECYAAAAKWLAEDFHYQSPAAIKDPRLCRVLPFWQHFFNQNKLDTKVVFIYRHPYSVAASLKKRDGFGFEISCLLWLTYTLDGLEKLQAGSLSLLSYEKLLSNPVETTKLLLNEKLRGVPSLKRLRYARIASSTVDAGKNHNPVAENTHSPAPDFCGSLACELYSELNTTASEGIAALARTYREKLNVLTEQSKPVLAMLQAELNCHVAAYQKLSALGVEYSHALATISKKDIMFERAILDAEKRVAGNKIYIRKCQARIREQDQLLKILGKKSELVENLQRALVDREKKLAQNISYIEKCEARIREQDQMILQLKQATFFWPIMYAAKKVLSHLLGKVRPLGQ